jgi:hypothetical protein
VKRARRLVLLVPGARLRERRARRPDRVVRDRRVPVPDRAREPGKSGSSRSTWTR